MREKTRKLLEILKSSLTGGDKSVRELMSLAESNGHKGGYVKAVCEANFFKSGRGVYSLQDGGYCNPRGKNVRLNPDEVKRIAQSVVLNRAVRLNEREVRKLAISEGIVNLPKNVSNVVRKEFWKSYDELLEAASGPEEKPPQADIMELSFVDDVSLILEKHGIGSGVAPCRILAGYLEGCLGVFLETQKCISAGEQPVLPTVQAGPDTSMDDVTVAAARKEVVGLRQIPKKVLVASLLQSQIAEFQRRPKIKAQITCGRLALSFVAQDRTSYDLPGADYCIIMKKTSHKLWRRMIACYGRDNVSLVNGVHSMEDKILNILFSK